MTPEQIRALREAEEHQRQDRAGSVKPTDYADPTMPISDSQADYSPASDSAGGAGKLFRALTPFLPRKDEPQVGPGTAGKATLPMPTEMVAGDDYPSPDKPGA